MADFVRAKGSNARPNGFKASGSILSTSCTRPNAEGEPTAAGDGVNEGAIHPWPAVAAAQFALDADDLAGLRLEVGEVRPGQLELGGPAPRRLVGGDLGSLQLEVLEGRQVTDGQPGLDLGLRERRPEHVQGAGAERGSTELVASAGVQVELDRIAVPELAVAADVGRLLVEAFQADVEVLVVPEVEELPAPVGEIRVADMNRRDEGPVPVGPACRRI